MEEDWEEFAMKRPQIKPLFVGELPHTPAEVIVSLQPEEGWEARENAVLNMGDDPQGRESQPITVAEVTAISDALGILESL